MATADGAWRCFVAVPIDDDLRRAIAGCVSTLRRQPGAERDWRWTDAGGWHVTLAFLGATEPAAVPGVEAALQQATTATGPRFMLSGGSLGAFASARHARVLWYGLDDPDGRMRALARGVQRALGMEPDPRFRTHLTLARARERFGADATQLLAAVQAPPGRLEVARVALYRSHLGRGPAQYEELFAAPLHGDGS